MLYWDVFKVQKIVYAMYTFSLIWVYACMIQTQLNYLQKFPYVLVCVCLCFFAKLVWSILQVYFKVHNPMLCGIPEVLCGTTNLWHLPQFSLFIWYHWNFKPSINDPSFISASPLLLLSSFCSLSLLPWVQLFEISHISWCKHFVFLLLFYFTYHNVL